MAKFDIIDEAIINAKPDIVYKALLGGGLRYKLRAEAKLLEGRAADQLGALTEITVPGRFPIKWTIKTVELIKNELWRTEYVGGAFRGEGLWTLEAIGENTKVSYHWRTRPCGLLRILAPFINIPKQHSALMKAGFASLNEYVKQKDRS